MASEIRSTGGDPFKRADIYELIAAANDAGLMPALSPSVTPLLTPEALAKAAAAGVSAVSLSLDASDAETHDSFRGVPGAFDRTLEAARWVREAGLELAGFADPEFPRVAGEVGVFLQSQRQRVG